MTHKNGTQALAEQEVEVEQAEPTQPETPAEPKLHSREWFDAVILGNEQAAAQKLAEYHQVMGAVDILKKQRALIVAE